MGSHAASQELLWIKTNKTVLLILSIWLMVVKGSYLLNCQNEVKLSVCTQWRQGKSRVTAALTFNLSTGRRQVVSFVPQPLYLCLRISRTHWTRGWVGSGAVPGASEKGRSHVTAGNQNTLPSLSSPLPSHYTDWAILAAEIVTQIIHVFQNKYLKAVAEYADMFSECIM
jgi:hypothetical protein